MKMTDQTLIIKEYYSPEEWMSTLQILAKYQQKEQQKSGFVLQTANYKNELLKWMNQFTSQDLIKLITIEDKWFSFSLRTMAKYQKENKNLVYQFKSEFEGMKDNFNFNNLISIGFHEKYQNFEYFFNSKSCEKNDKQIEKIINEIRVLDIHDQYDSITFHENFCKLKNLLEFFEYYSGNKCFTSQCNIFNDKKNNYYWRFPSWYDELSFHSLGEFLVASLERVISIKFLLYTSNLKKTNDKSQSIQFSLVNENKLCEFFQNRENLINYLFQEYKNNKEQIFKYVDLQKCFQEIIKVQSFIHDTRQNFLKFNSKNSIEKGGSYVFPEEETLCEKEISNLRETYLKTNEKDFIDNLLLTRFEISPVLYAFKKKVLDSIQMDYSHKLAADLMEENNNTCSSKKKKNSRKKKKEKNKELFQIYDVILESEENKYASEPNKANDNEELDQDQLNIVIRNPINKINTSNYSFNDQPHKNLLCQIYQNSFNIDKENSKNLIEDNYIEETKDLLESLSIANRREDQNKNSNVLDKFSLREDDFVLLNEKERNFEINVKKTMGEKNQIKDIFTIQDRQQNFLESPNDYQVNYKPIINKESDRKNILKFPVPKTKSLISTQNSNQPKIFSITNRQTFSEENFENLLSINMNSINQINSNILNPIMSLDGRNNSLFDEINSEAFETDTAYSSTNISDNQSIRFNFFRRHQFNTPSFDKEIRNKNTDEKNTNDRKSVPTKKSNTNELKEEKIHEQRININNVINQIMIPEEQSISRTSKNNSEENKEKEGEDIQEGENNKKPKKKHRNKKKKKNSIVNKVIGLKRPDSKASIEEINIKIEKSLMNEDQENKEILNLEIIPQRENLDQKLITQNNQTNLAIENSPNSLQPNPLIINQNNNTGQFTLSNYNNNDNLSSHHSESKTINQNESFSYSRRKSTLNDHLYIQSQYIEDNFDDSKSNKSFNSYNTFKKRNYFNSSFSHNSLNIFNYQPKKYKCFNYSDQNIFGNNHIYFTPKVNTKGNNFFFQNEGNFSELSSKGTNLNLYFQNNNFMNMMVNGPNFNSSLLTSISNPNFNEGSPFFTKLNEDIKEYLLNVSSIQDKISDYKNFLIDLIENTIKTEWKNLSIHIFGSMATDLCIESSDIDITIKFTDPPKNISFENLIFSFTRVLLEMKIFDSVIPITTASVPIIKLTADPLKFLTEDLKLKFSDFLNSKIFEEYRFDKEEISKIKIDMNFSDSTATFEAVNWIKEQILIYPEVRPLTLILKRLLQVNKCNSSFDGGMSSYSLVLLIISFLKFSKLQGVVKNLVNLLEFYGKGFDFSKSIVDVSQINPFIIPGNVLEIYPCILDPINYNNVSKSSYRVNDFRMAFSTGFEFLNDYKICEGEGKNIIYELLKSKVNN